MTHTYAAARPVVTATVALFHREASGVWRVFLGKRNPASQAYPGHWCLAGGKLDAKSDTHPGETIEQAALREVLEETAIAVRHDQLNLLLISSEPDKDPRGHFIDIVYTAIVTDAQAATMVPGSDLVDGGWYDIKQFTLIAPFAFDHQALLAKAYRRIRGWE